MKEEILRHIGKRIRQYRHYRSLSLQQLADRLKKSKATVSYYESGKVAIDIATLFEIAKALGVQLQQLVDYVSPDERAGSKLIKGPSTTIEQVYIYRFNGITKKIELSILKLKHNYVMDEVDVTLFLNLENEESLETAQYLYRGKLKYFDTAIIIILDNQDNATDQIFLIFVNTLKKFDKVAGLLAGLASNPISPMCSKVVISKNPLSRNQALHDWLLISKEEIRNLKNTNMLYLTINQIE